MAIQDGLSEADVVRRLIDIGLDLAPEIKEPMLPASRSGLERKKITLTLPVFIVDLARERASQKRMALSRWIASLIQSHVFQPPVVTTTELKCLNENNRQLRGIGTNLNQIAKAFNQLDIDIRKLKLLGELEVVVKENLTVLDKLYRAVNRSWSVDR
jgi:hypothetical protein